MAGVLKSGIGPIQEQLRREQEAFNKPVKDVLKEFAQENQSDAQKEGEEKGKQAPKPAYDLLWGDLTARDETRVLQDGSIETTSYTPIDYNESRDDGRIWQVVTTTRKPGEHNTYEQSKVKRSFFFNGVGNAQVREEMLELVYQLRRAQAELDPPKEQKKSPLLKELEKSDGGTKVEELGPVLSEAQKAYQGASYAYGKSVAPYFARSFLKTHLDRLNQLKIEEAAYETPEEAYLLTLENTFQQVGLQLQPNHARSHYITQDHSSGSQISFSFVVTDPINQELQGGLVVVDEISLRTVAGKSKILSNRKIVVAPWTPPSEREYWAGKLQAFYQADGKKLKREVGLQEPAARKFYMTMAVVLNSGAIPHLPPEELIVENLEPVKTPLSNSGSVREAMSAANNQITAAPLKKFNPYLELSLVLAEYAALQKSGGEFGITEREIPLEIAQQIKAMQAQIQMYQGGDPQATSDVINPEIFNKLIQRYQEPALVQSQYYDVLRQALGDDVPLDLRNLSLSFKVTHGTDGMSRLHCYYTFDLTSYDGVSRGEIAFQETFEIFQGQLFKINRQVKARGQDPQGKIARATARIQQAIDNSNLPEPPKAEEGKVPPLTFINDKSPLAQAFVQTLLPDVAPELVMPSEQDLLRVQKTVTADPVRRRHLETLVRVDSALAPLLETLAVSPRVRVGITRYLKASQYADPNSKEFEEAKNSLMLALKECADKAPTVAAYKMQKMKSQASGQPEMPKSSLPLGELSEEERKYQVYFELIEIVQGAASGESIRTLWKKSQRLDSPTLQKALAEALEPRLKYKLNQEGLKVLEQAALAMAAEKGRRGSAWFAEDFDTEANQEAIVALFKVANRQLAIDPKQSPFDLLRDVSPDKPLQRQWKWLILGDANILKKINSAALETDDRLQVRAYIALVREMKAEKLWQGAQYLGDHLTLDRMPPTPTFEGIDAFTQYAGMLLQPQLEKIAQKTQSDVIEEKCKDEAEWISLKQQDDQFWEIYPQAKKKVGADIFAQAQEQAKASGKPLTEEDFVQLSEQVESATLQALQQERIAPLTPEQQARYQSLSSQLHQKYDAALQGQLAEVDKKFEKPLAEQARLEKKLKFIKPQEGQGSETAPITQFFSAWQQALAQNPEAHPIQLLQSLPLSEEAQQVQAHLLDENSWYRQLIGVFLLEDPTQMPAAFAQALANHSDYTEDTAKELVAEYRSYFQSEQVKTQVVKDRRVASILTIRFFLHLELQRDSFTLQQYAGANQSRETQRSKILAEHLNQECIEPALKIAGKKAGKKISEHSDALMKLSMMMRQVGLSDAAQNPIRILEKINEEMIDQALADEINSLGKASAGDEDQEEDIEEQKAHLRVVYANVKKQVEQMKEDPFLESIGDVSEHINPFERRELYGERVEEYLKLPMTIELVGAMRDAKTSEERQAILAKVIKGKNLRLQQKKQREAEAAGEIEEVEIEKEEKEPSDTEVIDKGIDALDLPKSLSRQLEALADAVSEDEVEGILKKIQDDSFFNSISEEEKESYALSYEILLGDPQSGRSGFNPMSLVHTKPTDSIMYDKKRTEQEKEELLATQGYEDLSGQLNNLVASLHGNSNHGQVVSDMLLHSAEELSRPEISLLPMAAGIYAGPLVSRWVIGRSSVAALHPVMQRVVAGSAGALSEGVIGFGLDKAARSAFEASEGQFDHVWRDLGISVGSAFAVRGASAVAENTIWRWAGRPVRVGTPAPQRTPMGGARLPRPIKGGKYDGMVRQPSGVGKWAAGVGEHGLIFGSMYGVQSAAGMASNPEWDAFQQFLETTGSYARSMALYSTVNGLSGGRVAYDMARIHGDTKRVQDLNALTHAKPTLRNPELVDTVTVQRYRTGYDPEAIVKQQLKEQLGLDDGALADIDVSVDYGKITIKDKRGENEASPSTVGEGETAPASQLTRLKLDDAGTATQEIAPGQDFVVQDGQTIRLGDNTITLQVPQPRPQGPVSPVEQTLLYILLQVPKDAQQGMAQAGYRAKSFADWIKAIRHKPNWKEIELPPLPEGPSPLSRPQQDHKGNVHPLDPIESALLSVQDGMLPLSHLPEALGIRAKAEALMRAKVKELERQGLTQENFTANDRTDSHLSQLDPIQQQYILALKAEALVVAVAAAEDVEDVKEALTKAEKGGLAKVSGQTIAQIRGKLEASKPDTTLPLWLRQKVRTLHENQSTSNPPPPASYVELLAKWVEADLAMDLPNGSGTDTFAATQRAIRREIDQATPGAQALLMKSDSVVIGRGKSRQNKQRAILDAYFGRSGQREFATEAQAFKVATLMGRAGLANEVSLSKNVDANFNTVYVLQRQAVGTKSDINVDTLVVNRPSHPGSSSPTQALFTQAEAYQFVVAHLPQPTPAAKGATPTRPTLIGEPYMVLMHPQGGMKLVLKQKTQDGQPITGQYELSVSYTLKAKDKDAGTIDQALRELVNVGRYDFGDGVQVEVVLPPAKPFADFDLGLPHVSGAPKDIKQKSGTWGPFLPRVRNTRGKKKRGSGKQDTPSQKAKPTTNGPTQPQVMTSEQAATLKSSLSIIKSQYRLASRKEMRGVEIIEENGVWMLKIERGGETYKITDPKKVRKILDDLENKVAKMQQEEASTLPPRPAPPASATPSAPASPPPAAPAPRPAAQLPKPAGLRKPTAPSEPVQPSPPPKPAAAPKPVASASKSGGRDLLSELAALEAEYREMTGGRKLIDKEKRSLTDENTAVLYQDKNGAFKKEPLETFIAKVGRAIEQKKAELAAQSGSSD